LNIFIKNLIYNKAQGQTYDRVGLDLKQPVFAHGQLYVAVSRVRTFDSIKIRVHKIQDAQGQRTINDLRGTFTKNRVLYAALTHHPDVWNDPNFQPRTSAPIFNPLLHQHRTVIPQFAHDRERVTYRNRGGNDRGRGSRTDTGRGRGSRTDTGPGRGSRLGTD
jgi:hypothetical protein